MQKTKTFSEEKAASITYQLLTALEFLHGRETIHRDIKPDNILVGDNDVIKICMLLYSNLWLHI